MTNLRLLAVCVAAFFVEVACGWHVKISTLDDSPSSDNDNGAVASVVDLQGLLDCPNFREIESLDIRLEKGGPRWQFQLSKETTKRNWFVALTKDHRVRVSFYRYNVLGIHRIAGVVQDSEMGYWYDITPDVDGVALVSVVADAEVAPFVDPIIPSLALPSFSQSSYAASRHNVFDSVRDSLLEARKLLSSYIPINFLDNIDIDEYDDDEDNTYIDIMVVWTHQAECVKSHQDPSCQVSTATRQNMMLSIHFFLQETNDVFSNSGLHLKLRLAHGQRVRYKESTFTQALEDLKNGIIPNVDDRRKQHQADLVMMLIDGTADYPETGAAYNNYDHISAEYMYSVVATQFSSIWFLPAHELGHNFGCSHDRGTVDMCHDTSKTSYGYQDPQCRFRDIMSYPIQTRACDDEGTQRHQQACPIIPYFSNNREEGRYDGASLGGPNNDCAGQIERVQDRIANFY